MLNRAFVAALSSALLFTLLIATPASTRALSTIYVGPGGGSGSCASPDFDINGSSDNSEIAEAAASATSGDTIYLCAGTYHFGAEVILAEVAGGKSLIFQGAGKSRTILDATGANSRFFHASDVTLTFRDLTMQNARAENWVGAVWGEGTTHIIIERSAFINNYAPFGIGAIFSREGTVSVTSSLFQGNYSGYLESEYWGGGAITVNGDDAVVFITNSMFNNNYSARPGGAINSRGPLVINNSTFMNNESEEDGGAISAYDDLRITASSFTGNVTYEEGGSVYVECDEFVDVSRSTFAGNHAVGAGADGGALNIRCINPWVDLSFDRNTFTKNTAGDDGGAIDEDSGNLMVFSGNKFTRNSSIDNGGAIWANVIELSRNIFTSNTTSGCGGAVFVSGTDFGTAREGRNRFSGNRARGNSRYADVCFGTYR